MELMECVVEKDSCLSYCAITCRLILATEYIQRDKSVHDLG